MIELNIMVLFCSFSAPFTFYQNIVVVLLAPELGDDSTYLFKHLYTHLNNKHAYLSKEQFFCNTTIFFLSFLYFARRKKTFFFFEQVQYIYNINNNRQSAHRRRRRRYH